MRVEVGDCQLDQRVLALPSISCRERAPIYRLLLECPVEGGMTPNPIMRGTSRFNLVKRIVSLTTR